MSDKKEEFIGEGIFDTKTAEQVLQENAEYADRTGIPYFSLGDGQIAVVRFLKDKALTFYQHRIWDQTAKKGSGGWTVLTCCRVNCPLCQAGDKPSFKGAYPIIHVDNIENDSSGKQVRIPRVKVLVRGVNDITILEKKGKRHPLTSADMEVERVGKGTQTQYIFEFTDKVAMPVCDFKEEDINLKKMFKLRLDAMDRLAKDIKARVARGEKPEPDSDQYNLQPPIQNSSGKDANEDDIPF